jgi:hypothetical protein
VLKDHGAALPDHRPCMLVEALLRYVEEDLAADRN